MLEADVRDFHSVHERSTAHRLAVHMEPFFGPEWNVDCEYDRDGQTRKALEGIAHCKQQKETDAILPDIIVHHRGDRGRDHNLLVIELKKDDTADVCDQRKLELLTCRGGQYGYQFGLYINIEGGKFKPTWYKDGQRLPDPS